VAALLGQTLKDVGDFAQELQCVVEKIKSAPSLSVKNACLNYAESQEKCRNRMRAFTKRWQF